MNNESDAVKMTAVPANSQASRNGSALLDIKDMRVWYHTRRGEAKAVDGVDLVIQRNEVFGIAGESGCGKSTLVKGLLRLTKLPAHIESGEAIFYRSAGDAGRMGVDLLNIDLAEMRRLRWRHLAYIPQSAMNVLNPVVRIENQMIDAILEHSDMSRNEARVEIARQLEMVGLEPSVARMYPHELSGGMKQRVAIASAVTLSPELIFADEPTTALDVNVQQIILQELQEIRERLGLTLVYVTHDMAVHAELADRMGIMYAGLIVEVGSVIEVLKDPLHPYSLALVESVPTVGGKRERMEGLPGRAPSPLEWPSGCRFHPRCERAMEVCRESIPPLQEVADGRMVACHLHHEG